MKYQLIKWLLPVCNIYKSFSIIDYCLNRSTYTNLPELIFQILDTISIDYKIINTKNLNTYTSKLEDFSLLCFNISNQKIDEKSIIYLTQKDQIKNFDYVVLIDIRSKISVKREVYIYILEKYFILYFPLIVFLISLIFNSSLLSFILLIEYIPIIYLYFMINEPNSFLISSICNKNNKENNCLSLLNKAESQVLNFSYAEAGMIFYLNLYFWTFISISVTDTCFLYFNVLSISLIALIIHSIIKQKKANLFCNVCLIVNSAGLLYFFIFLYLKLHCYNTSNFLLETSFFILGFAVISKLIIKDRNYNKLKDNFRTLFFSKKELILSNIENLSYTLKGHTLPIEDVIQHCFIENISNKRKNLLVILSTSCPACYDIAFKLRYLKNSSYRINLAFEVPNYSKIKFNENDALEPIYLSIIFSELGLSNFSKTMEIAKNKSNKIEIYKNILVKNNIKLQSIDIKQKWDSILHQNEFISRYSIIEFPYVCDERRVFPYFIDPQFYELLK